MSNRRKILVASTNPGKMVELSAMLDPDLEWLTLADFPGVPEVVEDGLTFEENACKKALGYAEATGCWTIADDSGLEVAILGGLPGIHSARFSGEKPTGSGRSLIDHKNIAKVLRVLGGVPPEKRAARFVCCLVLARAGEVLAVTHGILEGQIIEQEQGSGGFGYDPVFFLPEIGCTIAELDPEDKNAISHRGRATAQMKRLLPQLLDSCKP